MIRFGCQDAWIGDGGDMEMVVEVVAVRVVVMKGKGGFMVMMVVR